VEPLSLDIVNPEQTSAIIKDTHPDCVIHLAAIAAPQRVSRSPRVAWEVNLKGTMNLAEAVLQHAPSARFIFVSTSEVYGESFKAAGQALDEDARLDPTTPYAASKAAADLLIGQVSREGLNAVRFRPFNHTGPGQMDEYVIPAFASQIARIEMGLQEPILRVGNLDVQRDFLDVRDVVEAYTLAVLRRTELAPGTIMNIASGVPRRVGDILEALLSKARVAIRVEQDSARLRPNDTPLAVGDATRAGTLLSWAPKIDWEKTLNDVLDDWRAKTISTSKVM
jgi:GDP-4-dehydro-6-deoxy-D-mannose reductase